MAFDDTMGMVANSVALLNDTEVFAATASTGFLAQLETSEADLAGSKQRKAAGHFRAQRRRLSQMVEVSAARGHFDALIAAAMDDIAYQPNRGTPPWAALYDHMRTNSKSFESRTFSLESSGPTFTGTGTGTLYRISVDEQNHQLQAWFGDDYLLECVKDGRGTRYAGNELFELSGTPRTEDGLNFDAGGVGYLGQMTPIRPEGDQRNLVANGMFTQSTDTANVVDSLTNWAITTGGGTLELDTSNLYWSSSNPLPGVSTYNSLKFVGNDTITQDLVVDARKTFDLNAPYLCAVIVRRNDSCDGTFTFTVGQESEAVTVSSGMTNSQWNVVLANGSTDSDAWFLNLNQNSMTVSLQLASRTTGSLSVAGVVVAKMQRMGYLADQSSWGGRGCQGHYFAIGAWKAGAGAFTPFVAKDNWAWTDQDTARGIVQYWAARAGLGYLRHASSPSYADV